MSSKIQQNSSPKCRIGHQRGRKFDKEEDEEVLKRFNLDYLASNVKSFLICKPKYAVAGQNLFSTDNTLSLEDAVTEGGGR